MTTQCPHQGGVITPYRLLIHGLGSDTHVYIRARLSEMLRARSGSFAPILRLACYAQYRRPMRSNCCRIGFWKGCAGGLDSCGAHPPQPRRGQPKGSPYGCPSRSRHRPGPRKGRKLLERIEEWDARRLEMPRVARQDRKAVSVCRSGNRGPILTGSRNRQEAGRLVLESEWSSVHHRKHDRS